jgi:hypothetical protein
MSEFLKRERLEGEGGQIIDRVKQLIHEGNIRRVVVKQGEQTVAEFPLTAGVVGVVLAPVLAAIGALAALLTHCSIEVERVRDEEPSGERERAVTTAQQ